MMTLGRRRGARRGAIGLAAHALAAAAACQSGAGDSPRLDAGLYSPVDAPPEATGTSSGACGSPSAGGYNPVCVRSMSDACAQNQGPSGGLNGCDYRTWQDAVQTCGPTFTLATCGPYDVVMLFNVDVVYAYYFDPVTGALIATTLSGGCSSRCLAGPGTFTPPTCTPVPIACAGPDAASDSDAGSDADAGPDADADPG
jgi:hypothetical protein